MISDWCDWDCDQHCDQLVINTWVFICGYMLLYGAHLGVYFYFSIFFYYWPPGFLWAAQSLW